MPQPRTRASNTLDFLAFVEEAVQPGVRAHLRQALPAPVAEGLLDALPTDWHDVEHVHGPYVTELVRHLGRERAVEAWRRYSVERIETRPAYRALLHGAVRLFGHSLAPFLQLMPRVFAQGFRDCFEVQAQVGAREATVELTLAPAFAQHEAYGALLEGVLRSYVDFAQARDATLEVRADFPGRRVTALYRW